MDLWADRQESGSEQRALRSWICSSLPVCPSWLWRLDSCAPRSGVSFTIDEQSFEGQSLRSWRRIVDGRLGLSEAGRARAVLAQLCLQVYDPLMALR